MCLPFTAVSFNSQQDDLSQSFGPWAVKLRIVQMFIVVYRGLARVGHAEDESNENNKLYCCLKCLLRRTPILLLHFPIL